MSYTVKILADSIASGVRLTTVAATFPRFILAEVNTHRMLSRNSASSRAIPVEKNIARVLADPFIPEAFAANKKGMQAGEELNSAEQTRALMHWKLAMEAAVREARILAELGVHKQWANRLLEPFAWHTAIISATEWNNLFLQRDHPAASPEFRAWVQLLREAMAKSTPMPKDAGDWHLPFVYGDDEVQADRLYAHDRPCYFGMLTRLSVARCARVSYLTHEGKRDVQADLDLYEKLVTSEPKHLSPLEHAARVASFVDEKNCFYRPSLVDGKYAPFIGNFAWPWIQHRKDIAGEDGRSSRG